MKTIIQVTAVATPTAQPTDTPTPTPNVTSTPPEIPARTPTGKPIPAFPPAPKLSPFTISLATYKGQGFSFKYPANARVENVVPVSPAIDEIHLVGPLVWVGSGDADWFYNGPAYELIIRTYRNPDGLDVESWTRNYILTSWQKARDQGKPIDYKYFPLGNKQMNGDRVHQKDEIAMNAAARKPLTRWGCL